MSLFKDLQKFLTDAAGGAYDCYAVFFHLYFFSQYRKGQKLLILPHRLNQKLFVVIETVIVVCGFAKGLAGAFFTFRN